MICIINIRVIILVQISLFFKVFSYYNPFNTLFFLFYSLLVEYLNKFEFTPNSIKLIEYSEI